MKLELSPNMAPRSALRGIRPGAWQGIHRSWRATLTIGIALVAIGVGVPAWPQLDALKALAGARYGNYGVEIIGRWESLLAASRDLSREEQLRQVNDFINFNVVFGNDPEIWGAADYWATPLETLGRGLGDCEDFSIAKYVTLLRIGIPVDQLRITYVRAETNFDGTPLVQAHMVLAYYEKPDAVPLILDNLVGDVRSASRRPDLKPVFGFNSQGMWVGGVRSATDPTARLSRWRDLLGRMARDGIL